MRRVDSHALHRIACFSMRAFLQRQRENLLANLVASAIFAGLAAVVSWLSSLPPVSVPAWLFVGLLAFAGWWWWSSTRVKKLRPVVDESFGVEQVYIVEKNFIDCKFDGSELIFCGRRGFSLKNCIFVQPRLKFEGPAGVVLYQLVMLRKDPAFRPIADFSLQ
jgi:hypothetical protein